MRAVVLLLGWALALNAENGRREMAAVEVGDRGNLAVQLREHDDESADPTAAPTAAPAGATAAPAYPATALAADATTAVPAGPTAEPTAAPTVVPDEVLPPGQGVTLPQADVTAKPTLAPGTPTAVPIIIEPNQATVPPPPESVKNQTQEKWDGDFDTNNPLMGGTLWQYTGPPVVVGLVVLMILGLYSLAQGEEYDDVVDEENELPENMYGETFTTMIMSHHRLKKDGFHIGVIWELFSSLLLLALTYGTVLIMVQVAFATISSVDEDVEERDSLFQKFKDPVLWQGQDWEHFPDTAWRRESMVWFCHDIIYGKAKHVNQLGNTWNTFSWVILVIWFSYMLTELRDCLMFSALINDTESIESAEDMVEEDKEAGEIVVTGLTASVKFFATIFILLPKLFLNLLVCYIGAVFLMFNDLDDDLQEVLLKTIEMVFILEMDEVIYEAFTSHKKKQQLGQIEMPRCKSKGFWKLVSIYGEFPRLVCVIVLATACAMYMHSESHSAAVLTSHQTGVVEGCCNFMQYLKGSGHKTPLAAGNPCSSFRENYEVPMGIHVEGHVNATENATDVAAVAEPVAEAASLIMSHVMSKLVH